MVLEEIITKMEISFFAMALVLLAGFVGSFGAILLKQGSRRIRLKNRKLLIGLSMYGLGALIYIIALRYGSVSILYPLASTSYIWISLLSVRFLGEQMNSMKWMGITAIIFGVGLIGFS